MQDNHNLIDNLARRATAGTLKRIYTASGNDMIRKLQADLQRDFSTIDNGKAETLSDAYDLYLTAYSFLWDQIMVKANDEQTEISRTLRNGETKTRTVFQWACVEIRRAVYANKAVDGGGKYVYLEDLTASDDETASDALDREYVRMGKYNGIQTWEDFTNHSDLLEQLDLKYRESIIVTARMQGYSVSAIAEKLGVSQQAISKTLAKLQTRVIETMPDAVRGYRGERNRSK